MNRNSDSPSLQAKIIVLGDPRTGKTSLIHSLDPTCRKVHNGGCFGDDATFTVMEIPSNEIDHASSNIALKFWEFSGADTREQEIAFPGALFCIITFDLRAPETANAAFNKWIAMKELHIPESFLFVIGTFLDFPTQRRIDLIEISKACSQKEAIYIEVSTREGSNISLLRRLICQRVSYMLKLREELKRLPRYINQDKFVLDTPYSDEAKVPDLNVELLSPCILDRTIFPNSVGHILSNVLAIDYWPGFDNEQNSLQLIGKRIVDFIGDLSEGLNLSNPSLDITYFKYHEFAIPEPDLQEIKHLFNLMDLTLPKGLRDEMREHKSPLTTVKMKVRLPDNSASLLILQSGCNIDATVKKFMFEHKMDDRNGTMERRLIDIGTNMLARAEEEVEKKMSNENNLMKSHFHSTTSILNGERPKKCKAKIQLPNNQTIETIVLVGDDPLTISKRIAQQYNLSQGYQHKIWEQLQKSLEAFERINVSRNKS